MERNSRLIHLVRTYFGSPKLFLLVLFLISLRFLFPGTTTFLDDEAKLIDFAFQANQKGDLIVPLGLLGTKGFRYGPVGATFYLWLLFFTKNVYLIVFFKNLIVTGLTCFGIGTILGRVRDFDKSLWLFLFLSPYLFIYSRMLWDNPFLISLTAIAFASYLIFYQDKKILFFYLSILFFSLSLLTHLMVIPLCLAISTHFLLFGMKDLSKKWFIVISGFVLAAVLLSPYLSYVVKNRADVIREVASLKSLWFPFYGVKIYSFVDFEYFFGKRWEKLVFDSPVLFQVLRSTKAFWYLFLLVIPIGWFQIIKNVFKASDRNSIHFHLSFLSFLTLVFHIFLSLYGGLFKHPHYFNGVWIIHFLCLAYGVQYLFSFKKWGDRIVYSYLVAMFFMLLGVFRISFVHQGARSTRFGPNLNQQIEIAKKLNEINSSIPVEYKTYHFQLSDRSIEILRKLAPANEINLGKQTEIEIEVDYKYAQHAFQEKGYAQIEVKTK